MATSIDKKSKTVAVSTAHLASTIRESCRVARESPILLAAVSAAARKSKSMTRKVPRPKKKLLQASSLRSLRRATTRNRRSRRSRKRMFSRLSRLRFLARNYRGSCSSKLMLCRKHKS